MNFGDMALDIIHTAKTFEVENAAKLIAKDLKIAYLSGMINIAESKK